MNIEIHSAPEKMIRSSQSGDWRYNYQSHFNILVSDQLKEPSQLAVAIHELVEAYLCRDAGIPEKEVCDFDDRYEKERKEGRHPQEHEPGDDPEAPYREQHMAATHVERAVCHALGLNWTEHEQSVMNSGGDHH